MGVALGQISRWNCRAMKMLLVEADGLEQHPEKGVGSRVSWPSKRWGLKGN